jgi:Regulator of chromosome condensation (RCC1) repeat
MRTAGQTDVPQGLGNVVSLAASKEYALALKSDGTVIAWGDYPSLPPELTNIVAIAAAQNHSLGLTADGKVLAWGTNLSGEGTVPAGLMAVQALSAAWSYSLALVEAVKAITPVRLLNPAWSGHRFSVSFPSRGGVSYALEYEAALGCGAWTNLPPVPGTGGTLTLTDPSADAPARFYRVQSQ